MAPAYTGIITGIAFGVVAVFGIINKIFSTYIAQDGTLSEWRIVFGTSAVIAILPVFFFTVWGSADRQPWATIHSSQTLSAATVEGIISVEKEKGLPTSPSEFRAKEEEDEEEGHGSEGEQEDDEAVVSALRLRMFLETDETATQGEEEEDAEKAQRF
jgi:hypothetical protein